MGSLLHKLGDLLKEEYGLQKSVKRDVESVERELTSMHATLRTVAEVPVEQLDEQDKLWTREAMDLTYGIERVVDKFWARQLMAADPSAAGPNGCIAKMNFKLATAMARRQFATDIRDFKQLIEDLAKWRQGSTRYNIKGSIEHGIGMDPSMDSLLSKVGEVLSDEYKLRKGVKRVVQSLTREMTSISNFLRTVAEVPGKDSLLSRAMMDLTRDIERVVDRLLSRRLMAADPPAAGPNGCIAKLSLKLATAKARREFATNIRDLNQHIKKWVRGYDWNAIRPARRVFGDARIFCSADEFVGLDGPVEELVRKILPEEGEGGSTSNRQLKVASIVGSEGMGKTTLAVWVYRRLIKKFDCGAFLPMTTTTDIERLLRNMLSRLHLPVFGRGLMDVQHMIGVIRQALKDKRYFIVLDDIWDTKVWDIIKSALIENSNGSAVLTTSRRTDVALYIGGVYTLAPLSKPYSKQLFYSGLFGPGNNCPPELAEISEKIIEKCSGIPSAIITTIDLLKRKKKGWHEVLDSIDYGTGRDSYTGSLDAPMHSLIAAQRGLDLFKEEDELVGLEGRVEELVKILTEEGSELKVASIVGPPGVGKTALAKQVYKRLKPQFECTALVTWVSTEPDVKIVLSSILRQIGQQDQDNFGSRDLRMYIDDIREALRVKRYFILVDDIQDMLAWRVMKCALIENSNSSAILTTSRITDVARDAGGVYTLAPLAEIYSRNLFHRRTFGPEDKCPPEFTEISEKIIRKCDRIPLAIITTACLLAGKKRMEEWHEVHDSNNYGIERNSNSMRSILALSYTGLSPHLRSCLLYLSMFGKDYEISVDRLIWGWIAEGFVAEQGGMTPQEVGEQYLSELINRNLIVPMDVGAGGKALSCRLYDMVQELIISLSTEENFVTISDGRQGRVRPGTVKRLSIQGNNPLPPQEVLSHVRSLVVSGDANLMPSLSEFQGVRVLDLGGCSDFLEDNHLKGIKNLFFLKYLVIGGECVTGIPKEIGSLLFLQTLDLRLTSVKELPQSIARARQLKCLRVNSRTRIPYGIGKMEGLEVLGDINISNPELLKELCSLTKLMVLGIAIWSWDESYGDALLEHLGSLLEKGSIQSLSILTCCPLDFLRKLDAEKAPISLQKLEIRQSTLLVLPAWISLLENLSSLSIEVQKLSEDIISVLGRMPSLCSLSLTSKREPEGRFRECTEEFRDLTGFHVVSNTMGKMFEPGALPMLERLKVSFEASRTEDVSPQFDFGLENLPSSLEHLRVEINCFNASFGLVQKAEAAIREQIKRGRSRRPNLEIQRVREEDMVDDEDVREAVRRKWSSVTYN